LLNKNGIFVLSIDKVQSDVIDFNSRKIRLFPDDKEAILKFIENSNLSIKHIQDIENAYVIIANKS
jgi:hypothetical protein